MKRVLLALCLLVASSLALALPTPKEIDAAVKAGHLGQAETMLHEVIQAKPGSAKAHYELGQVLALASRPAEALKELQEAERLDPALKFATDPLHFRNLTNQVKRAAATTAPARSAGPAAPASTASTAVPANGPAASIPWGFLLLGGGGVVLVWLLLRRRAAPRVPATPTPFGQPAVADGGYGTGFGNGYGNSYGYGQPPAPPQAPWGGGVGGAVLGGVAGLAAGYGLAKLLEGREAGSSGAHSAGNLDSNLTPVPPVALDYGDFDAGRGDGWDGDAGGDDNW